MDTEELFTVRYQQLLQCLNDQSNASMLTLSQILRQLLVDGTALVNLANRQHRLTILFLVGMSTVERQREMSSFNLPIPNVHFLGEFPPTENKKGLSLQKFLAFEVGKFNDSHFSVRSLIKVCANKLGGVHVDDEKNDSQEEREVREFGKLLEGMGLNSAFASLVIIGRVTFEAITPLARRILEARK